MRHLVLTAGTWEETMLGNSRQIRNLSLIDIHDDARSKETYAPLSAGSSNQRLSMCKVFQSGKVVIWDKLNDGKESYEQVKRE